ncbi:hypothetical protein PVL29_001404 [Vitis rotundifolia]|uniref:HMA domain-containing protein n=1 Tax=Vitis rotundifolia TaxID=103349 RepID=A0AA39AMW2_VITRO|nr:hypothetical protein PVL29_001404 [Vitis rotundifolia]
MGKKNGENEKKDTTVDPKSRDKKQEESKEDIILKVYMHCEGCANKVLKSLRGFDGVEEVETDRKSHKVTVKGEKADPLKVLERVKKKYGKNVELLSPIPKAKEPQDNKKEEKEEPKVMIVVLKVYMHCENCAVEIKKTILKMKGVRTVEPDTKNSTVTVKGVFDPPKLVDHLQNRAGKHAIILKQDEEKKQKKQQVKEMRKTDKKTDIKEGIEEQWGNEIDSNFFYYNSQYPYQHLYPYQFFSEENTNACSIL